MLLTPHHQRRARSVAPVRGAATIDASLISLLKARRAWLCRIESTLAALGLSSTELSVLRCLRDAVGPLPSRELVTEEAGQAPKSLDVAIQGLLAKGLTEPASARKRERGARFSITPLGVLRHAEGARALDEVSATFAALGSGEDRAALDRIVAGLLVAGD
jgi:DNA-binding MarR family transcriptional regulator